MKRLCRSEAGGGCCGVDGRLLLPPPHSAPPSAPQLRARRWPRPFIPPSPEYSSTQVGRQRGPAPRVTLPLGPRRPTWASHATPLATPSYGPCPQSRPLILPSLFCLCLLLWAQSQFLASPTPRLSSTFGPAPHNLPLVPPLMSCPD